MKILYYKTQLGFSLKPTSSEQQKQLDKEKIELYEWWLISLTLVQWRFLMNKVNSLGQLLFDLNYAYIVIVIIKLFRRKLKTLVVGIWILLESS